MAKRFSAQILKRDLPFFSALEIDGNLPNGVFLSDSGDLGAAVVFRDVKPFDKTLRLIPPVLFVGVGCKRNTPRETIDKALDDTFAANGLLPRAVSGFASIDVKSDETGLLECVKDRGGDIRFFSAEELRAAPWAWTTSVSAPRSWPPEREQGSS